MGKKTDMICLCDAINSSAEPSPIVWHKSWQKRSVKF